MKDVNGNELKVGDVVLIPAVVDSLNGEEHLTVMTTKVRKYNNQSERIGSIEFRVVVRATPNDRAEITFDDLFSSNAKTPIA